MKSKRIIRVTTVPISLHYLLRGQLSFLKENHWEVLAISADGLEREEILKEVNHQVVLMTRAITPWRDFIALVRLVMVFKKFQPNIVHTHTPKAGLLGMLAAWWCNVPVRLHTVAGLPLMEATGLKHWILSVTENLTYACATGVYPNSKGLLEFMQLKFARYKNKFKLIGNGSSNGIDASHFRRTEELEEKANALRNIWKLEPDELVYCFVGRLVKDKGLVELVTAFRQLPSKARLLMVGHFEEELDPLPESIVQFLKNDSRVILAGFQKDVRAWIMAADGFVFPSYREGFPNVVMQASCLEVPCIVSNINGCNEIIHSENGWIVPVKDSDALKNAMIRLAELTPQQRREMGKRTREFVVRHFEQKELWGALLQEYELVLQESKH